MVLLFDVSFAFSYRRFADESYVASFNISSAGARLFKCEVQKGSSKSHTLHRKANKGNTCFANIEIPPETHNEAMSACVVEEIDDDCVLSTSILVAPILATYAEVRHGSQADFSQQ